MQPIGYIMWTQAHIAEPLKNPSLHSLPLSLSLYLFYIFHCHQIQVFYMVSEPQSSNEQLNPSASAFQKKKKSHRKHLNTNLIFSENLISQISSPSRDRSNTISRSPFRLSTRLHAQPEDSVFLQILTRCRNYQAPDLHHLGTYQKNQYHQSTDRWPIYSQPQKSRRSNGGRPSSATNISGREIHVPPDDSCTSRTFCQSRPATSALPDP